MRQLSLACLLFVAALALSGCANRSLCGGGCGGGGLRDGLGPCMGRCASGSQRMFGQSAEGAAASGMYAGHGGHGHCGYFASGWRGGCHNDEYRKDQPPYGPQTAQVAYPYYTTRGPRDFLQDNPPSIGP